MAQPAAIIRIKNLRLRTFIGIKEEEINNRQDIVINVVIHYPADKARASEDINDALNYRTLNRDQMYALIAKGHPLEEKALAEGSFAWEWLEGQTLLLQNRTQRQGQYILQELQNRGLKAQEVLESSNIRAAAALAANGYGVAFMSGELLRNLHLDTDFSAVPLRDCTLPLESVAAWRAGNYLPRYTQAFIELMGQAEKV